MLLISSSHILPLNIPFVYVWCYTVAAFAHRVSAAYFVGGEAVLGPEHCIVGFRNLKKATCSHSIF
jgi:hypothetical protein